MIRCPGETLGIFWWGCAAGNMERLAHTRASLAEFCYPILDSPNPTYPRVVFRLSCVNLNLPIDFFIFLNGNSRFPLSRLEADWSFSWKMKPYSRPYPRMNCLKTIPYKAARTNIAQVWQYPPPPLLGGFPIVINVRTGGPSSVWDFLIFKLRVAGVRSMRV